MLVKCYFWGSGTGDTKWTKGNGVKKWHLMGIELLTAHDKLTTKRTSFTHHFLWYRIPHFIHYFILPAPGLKGFCCCHSGLLIEWQMNHPHDILTKSKMSRALILRHGSVLSWPQARVTSRERHVTDTEDVSPAEVSNNKEAAVPNP